MLACMACNGQKKRLTLVNRQCLSQGFLINHKHRMCVPTTAGWEPRLRKSDFLALRGWGLLRAPLPLPLRLLALGGVWWWTVLQSSRQGHGAGWPFLVPCWHYGLVHLLVHSWCTIWQISASSLFFYFLCAFLRTTNEEDHLGCEQSITMREMTTISMISAAISEDSSEWFSFLLEAFARTEAAPCCRFWRANLSSFENGDFSSPKTQICYALCT